MNFKESKCHCSECVAMCLNRPCWPTPDEAQRIIDAGLGHKLMRDYWVEKNGETSVLCGAIVGHEGGVAPFWPHGRCAFLDEAGLCELHDKGLKPLEGRVAIHDGETTQPVREYVVSLWRKPEAKAVVNDWLS